MGVLTSYREQVQAEGFSEEKTTEEKTSEEKNDDKKTPAEDPLPCLECWSPTFWRSIYGGPLRCAVCDTWPATSFVGERWTLLTLAGDRLAWSRPGEDPGQLGAIEADGLRVYETEDGEGCWLTIERV